jgi:phosphatidylserine decarboxylase
MKMTKTKKRWTIILLLIAIIIIIAFLPSKQQDPIQYFERESGQLETEKVAGEKWLVWLYNNPIGEATLWALAKRKLVSSIYGKMMDQPSSAKKITPFIEEFAIDMSSAQEKEFRNFNDFFTRKLKNNARPVDTTLNVVVSPSDGKVLAYADLSNSDFIVKGFRFDVSTFLEDPVLAHKYKDGTLLIVRLAPVDYHRFHFPVSGSLTEDKKIEGYYYSVSPFALRKKAEILCLNKREYTTISNPLLGDVTMAEVGATMAGSIVQTFKGNSAKKGEEKGYFKFGGSTVVLLFEKGKINIDKDLLANSVKGIETEVKMGERIGEASMTQF